MQIADLSTPTFHADPYPVYEQLRAAGPFVPLMPGMWLTGSYSIAETLLKDRRLGKRYMEYARMRCGDEHIKGIAFQTMHRSILMLNPPEHTRLKALLMKAFNAKQVAEFCRSVQNIADELVDRFIEAGSVDLMPAFAHPLPIAAICKLFGLDEDETRFFVTEGASMIRPFSRVLDIADMTLDEIDAANEATQKLQDFFTRKFQERRQSPGGDLISLLLTVEEDGHRLTEEEIVANIIFTFAAGHETTTNMIGNALICLYRNPEQLARVKQDLSLLPQCINECLRYESSLQMSSREVLEDMEFEGFRFSSGETIAFCLGAANRDPRRFSEPDRLIIDRPDAGSRHLAFGGGAHYCIGAMLAVTELEIALRTLLRRLPNLQITNLNDLHWLPTNTVRGVFSLQATW